MWKNLKNLFFTIEKWKDSMNVTGSSWNHMPIKNFIFSMVPCPLPLFTFLYIKYILILNILICFHMFYSVPLIKCIWIVMNWWTLKTATSVSLLHYAAGKGILRDRSEGGGGRWAIEVGGGRARAEKRLRIQMSRSEVGKAGSLLQVNSHHQGFFLPPHLSIPLPLSHILLFSPLPLSLDRWKGEVGDRLKLTF